MTWTELLTAEAKDTYKATFGLMEFLEDSELDFKPEAGSNWMTAGQLIRHMTTACGWCCRAFVTGDWGMPEGADVEDMSEEEMLPPAEKMPAADSVAQARELIEKDRDLALEMIEAAGEEDLGSKMTTAPWNPTLEFPLGQRLLHMIAHLAQHKGQLFYYLKMMGKPVNTNHLWG